MTNFEHQSQPRRAMDAVVASAEVSCEETLDFVQACAIFEAVIVKEHPDIVFLPQRGAGPMGWTVTEFLKQDQLPLPEFVDLPIGTHRFVDRREHTQQSGIGSSEKRTLIKESLDSLYENGTYIPGESRLMLVDEVQSGGTISKAATAIRLAMDDRDDGQLLNLVAFQDSRHELVGGRNAKRTHVFESLSSNRRKNFKTNIIPAELFTVDRPALLDEIVRDPGCDSEYLTDHFQIVPNNGARGFFRALAHTYTHPDAALEEIVYLRQEIITVRLGTAALQESILEYVTDPRPVRSRSIQTANISELLDWWTHFAEIAKKSRQPRKSS